MRLRDGFLSVVFMCSFVVFAQHEKGFSGPSDKASLQVKERNLLSGFYGKFFVPQTSDMTLALTELIEVDPQSQSFCALDEWEHGEPCLMTFRRAMSYCNRYHQGLPSIRDLIDFFHTQVMVFRPLEPKQAEETLFHRIENGSRKRNSTEAKQAYVSHDEHPISYISASIDQNQPDYALAFQDGPEEGGIIMSEIGSDVFHSVRCLK